MAVNVINDWRHARGEERVLEDIPVEELDAVLCKFYTEVRRKDGKEYEPDNLAIMQASLDRHLKIRWPSVQYFTSFHLRDLF